VTDQSDFDVVIAAERALLDPTVRANPEAVAALLDESFTEIGASGRVWDRAGIIAALAESPGVGDREPSEFRCVRTQPDSILVTYRMAGGAGLVRRSSVWRRSADRWSILFHQGTTVQED
jgi:ribonuclease HI